MKELLEAARNATAAAHGTRTHAWVAGENRTVGAVRQHLLDAGFDRATVQAVVYREQGRTADERDATVLHRYQDAVAAGRDITDPDVLDELEFG
ncbi:MAG: SIP domain-containing protein [Pseudonocardiaceae bacterium]